MTEEKVYLLKDSWLKCEKVILSLGMKTKDKILKKLGIQKALYNCSKKKDLVDVINLRKIERVMKDLEIMLEQAHFIFDGEMILHIKNEKLERLGKLLKL